MIPPRYTELADRAAQLRLEISARAFELKEIEAELKDAALAGVFAVQPLNEPGREGRRVMLPGSYPRKLSIVITSDHLIGSFQHHSPKHSELLAILKDTPAPLGTFFKSPSKWENAYKEDGLAFRQRARAELGDKAEDFITACLAVDKHKVPKSQVRMDYGDND